MKTLVLLALVGACSAVILEREPFVRLIPADILRGNLHHIPSNIFYLRIKTNNVLSPSRYVTKLYIGHSRNGPWGSVTFCLRFLRSTFLKVYISQCLRFPNVYSFLMSILYRKNVYINCLMAVNCKI